VTLNEPGIKTFDIISKDEDWKELRKSYNPQFSRLFSEMLQAYKNGDWDQVTVQI